jgi:hypothetical protein
MKSTAKTATNEEILTEVKDISQTLQDFVQMVADEFTQVRHTQNEHSKVLSNHSKTLLDHTRLHMETKFEIRDVKSELHELKAIVQDLSRKHEAYIHDISDILDRIVVLESQSKRSISETHELQQHLQAVVDWATQAAKTLKIPLKLSS